MTGIALLVGAAGLLAACGGAASPASPAQGQTASGSSAAAPAGWDDLVRAAKQEGKLVLYANAGAPMRTLFAARFQELYGIQVEVVGGLPTDLVPKVLSERAANQYTYDVWYNTASTILSQLLPAGGVDPVRSALILPELSDPQTWVGGKLPYLDPDQQYIPASAATPTPLFTYNPDLVKPDELPKTLADLMSAKWQGKMALLDPGRPASSYSEWLYISNRQDTLQELARRKTPKESLDTYASDVAHGKWPIVLGGDGTHLQPLVDQGLPIRQVTFLDDAGGAITRASSTVALANRAPHPNAAKLFANWAYTKEGATLASKAVLHSSLRKDVPN
ncbi:MAG TPA: extracellular solute-binding protein, partial [Chloroflexota bacterium]|nr:extracellular solute-binding protein [Chloroflexota bacterium]